MNETFRHTYEYVVMALQNYNMGIHIASYVEFIRKMLWGSKTLTDSIANASRCVFLYGLSFDLANYNMCQVDTNGR